MPSAGKQATSFPGSLISGDGKMKDPGNEAGKQVTRVKRGKTVNQCRARENVSLVTSGREMKPVALNIFFT